LLSAAEPIRSESSEDQLNHLLAQWHSRRISCLAYTPNLKVSRNTFGA